MGQGLEWKMTPFINKVLWLKTSNNNNLKMVLMSFIKVETS